MTILIIITHELVMLEQINSKRNYSHLNNNGIALSELSLDHYFWSHFAFLQVRRATLPCVPSMDTVGFGALVLKLPLEIGSR